MSEENAEIDDQIEESIRRAEEYDDGDGLFQGI